VIGYYAGHVTLAELLAQRPELAEVGVAAQVAGFEVAAA
jgi:hypothetical protein